MSVYNAGRVNVRSSFFVLTSTATFEEECVAAAEIVRPIDDVHSTGVPWLVADEAGLVTGYAHAKPLKRLPLFCETTVYEAPGRVRRGSGSALYRELFLVRPTVFTPSLAASP
jgi:L-amino acid N-acyltransferase YncA